eukprot:403336671
MSKFEEFLQELSYLPTEIKRSLVLMRQLDVKKDELQNLNNRLAKGYFQSLQKKKTEKESQQDQKKVIDQIRQNYDHIERLSQEKLDLAKKAFAYVEANLGKVSTRMVQMEENIMKEQNEGIGGSMISSYKDQNSSKKTNYERSSSNIMNIGQGFVQNGRIDPKSKTIKKQQYGKNKHPGSSGKLGYQFSESSDDLDNPLEETKQQQQSSPSFGLNKYTFGDDGLVHNNYSSRKPIQSAKKSTVKKGGNNKGNIEMEDDDEIEPVTYEQNQELLRAFGGQIMSTTLQNQQLGMGNMGGNLNPHNTHAHNQLHAQSLMREPTYCFCNNVSYGDMIACDNKNCPYEWFHFPCVGLTQKPEGKWFCLKCQQTLQNIKRKHIIGANHNQSSNTPPPISSPLQLFQSSENQNSDNFNSDQVQIDTSTHKISTTKANQKPYKPQYSKKSLQVKKNIAKSRQSTRLVTKPIRYQQVDTIQQKSAKGSPAGGIKKLKQAAIIKPKSVLKSSHSKLIVKPLNIKNGKQSTRK